MIKKISDKNLGIISLILATLLFSLFGVFTRIISGSMGVYYLLSSRLLIMVFFFLLIGYFTKSFKTINKKDYFLFLFRSILVIIDASSFYIAVNKLPLGLALFIFYGASVASNFIYGSFFLNEKINKIKIISLIFAFIGLIFIYGGGFYNIAIIPSILALISGFCFGLTVSTSKKLTIKYSITQVNLISFFIAFIFSFILLFLTKEKINLYLPFNVWVTLIGFAITVVLGMLLTLYGFKNIESQKGGLILLFELIFVIILGFLFYKEIPTPNVLIGGLFIILSLALPNMNYNKNKL